MNAGNGGSEKGGSCENIIIFGIHFILKFHRNIGLLKMFGTLQEYSPNRDRYDSI